VREGGQGLAGSTVGGPAEADPAGLAGGLGDRRGAALGGGVLGAVDAVQDRPDLGQQLSEVDGADPGPRGQQLGPWVAGDALGDRRLELGMVASRVWSSWTWLSISRTRVAVGMPTGAVGAERSRASSAAGGLPPR
jgi:hypothetical protein